MTFWNPNPCTLIKKDYKALNGREASIYKALYYYTYPIMLNDGSTIGLYFSTHSHVVFWHNPDITFIVDVNSKKGPNKIGRDIFYFYLNAKDNGKVYPYGYEQEDDCTKDGEGYTCAYRIIKEGKMNY